MTQVRLSYAYGTSSQPLLGMTIGEKFDQACEQYAYSDAIVSLHQNVRLSYQQLQQQVNAFACSLQKLGLEKGDRLAIWSPNCVEWTITQFAAFKAGIILVNLNTDADKKIPVAGCDCGGDHVFYDTEKLLEGTVSIECPACKSPMSAEEAGMWD